MNKKLNFVITFVRNYLNLIRCQKPNVLTETELVNNEPSSVYFWSFLQILQQNNVRKCPSSIWCQDLNSRPSDYESPPLTTRPGLPPISLKCCIQRMPPMCYTDIMFLLVIACFGETHMNVRKYNSTKMLLAKSRKCIS